MAKPEWGTKRMCQSCAAKFYDLGRSPIVCPACGTAYDPESLLRSKRGKATTGTKAKAGKVEEAAVVEPVEAEEELDDIEEEAEVIEDADDLGEDDGLGKVSVDDEDKET